MIHSLLRTTVVLALAASAACASTRSSDDAAAPGMDAAATMDTPPPPPDVPPVDTPGADVVPHAYETSISVRLEPGEEVTQCVLRRLGNVTDEYVRRIRAHLGDSSHHLIFYRSAATEERLTPFRCSGFSGVQNIQMFDSPLLIAQQRDTTLNMPAGVGMNIGPNQMIRIEYHAINLGRTPIEATGRVWVDTVERNEAVTPADVMFWGNVAINIAPRTMADVHFFHRPRAGSRIFGLTSHTHHYGVLSTISVAENPPPADGGVARSSDARDLREVHRSTSWDDPPLTTFDTPLTLSGGQGLHLVCRYNNTSDQTVTFGESFNQEMCFMWAYFYPAPLGTQICAEGYGSRGVQCYPP